jgi:hypothetical protein
MFGLLYKLRVDFIRTAATGYAFIAALLPLAAIPVFSAQGGPFGTIYSAKNSEFSEVIPPDSCNSTRTQPEFSYVNEISPLI